MLDIWTALDGTDTTTIHAVIYIVLSIFTDLKLVLERIIIANSLNNYSITHTEERGEQVDLSALRPSLFDDQPPMAVRHS